MGLESCHRAAIYTSAAARLDSDEIASDSICSPVSSRDWVWLTCAGVGAIALSRWSVRCSCITLRHWVGALMPLSTRLNSRADFALLVGKIERHVTMVTASRCIPHWDCEVHPTARDVRFFGQRFGRGCSRVRHRRWFRYTASDYDGARASRSAVVRQQAHVASSMWPLICGWAAGLLYVVAKPRAMPTCDLSVGLLTRDARVQLCHSPTPGECVSRSSWRGSTLRALALAKFQQSAGDCIKRFYRRRVATVMGRTVIAIPRFQ